MDHTRHLPACPWCAKGARALPVFPTYKYDRVSERVEKTLQKNGVNFFSFFTYFLTVTQQVQ